MTAVARMTTAEISQVLVDNLGGTLVAAMAGAKDRKLPYRWCKEGTPRTDAEVRLRAAMEAWQMLTAQDGDGVARAWFIGTNPRLGDVQPFMALREGRLSEVVAAARAFADDGQMS